MSKIKRSCLKFKIYESGSFFFLSDIFGKSINFSMSIEYFSFLLQTDSKFRIKSENHIFCTKKLNCNYIKFLGVTSDFFTFY